MFTETSIGGGSSSSDPMLPSSLRSPPISQGEVTIHGVVSLSSMRERRKREQNIRDNLAPGQPSHVIAGAESDNNLAIRQAELLFAVRGLPGLVNNKLSVWSAVSGLSYKTKEDLAAQIIFLGTAKNDYNPFSTSTPQYGVAIRFKGIENMLYVCNPEKPVPIHHGEFLRYSIPKYNKRTVPFINCSPAEKIVPIIEPFSFSSLAQYTESLTLQAYSSKLKALPLISGHPGTRPGLGIGVDSRHINTTGRQEGLTPFQRLAQNEKTAEVVNLVHMLETLVMRGAVTINVNSNVFKQRHEPYSKVLKTKSAPEIKKARESVFELATYLGLVDGELLSEMNDDDIVTGMTAGSGEKVNEAQKDVFMVSKYPRIPPESVDLYHPNLNFANVKGAPIAGLTLRDQKKIEKANNTYIQLCQNAREARDVTRAEFERAELAQICAMNLSYCNPHVPNPRTDAYITHGGFA